jgi:hypothetical protein
VRQHPIGRPGPLRPLPSSRRSTGVGGRPKYTPTPRAYRLEQVEWLHIGNHMNDQQKWLYLVTFERQYRFEGQAFVGRGTLRTPVLLDGRVI